MTKSFGARTALVLALVAALGIGILVLRSSRDEESQRQHLETYVLGESLGAQSRAARFDRWSPPEGAQRWARDAMPSVTIKLPRLPPTFFYLLELTWSARGDQAVEVSLNDKPLGRSKVSGDEAQTQRFPLLGTLLRADEENVLRFAIEGEAAQGEGDPYPLQLAFHDLALHSLPVPKDGIGFDDEVYFLEGFGQVEESWRWTEGPRAKILYPLPPEEDRPTQVLRITAATPGRQPAEVWLNGVGIASWIVEDMTPDTGTIAIRGDLLRDDRPNEIELRLPDARSRQDDPDYRGLAVHNVWLGPSTQ